MARVMLREYEKATEIELQKEKERYVQSVHYQQELESQLEEQERKKQEAYEEFLKEKLMIDEICRKIYEEDQRWVGYILHHKYFLLLLLQGLTVILSSLFIIKMCSSYNYNYDNVCACIFRELEARLEKQRATREYVQEFLKKKEEV